MLSAIKNVSRMLAKGSLYIVGGAAIGYPVISATSNVAKGMSINDSLNNMVNETIGWNSQAPGPIAWNRVTQSVIRTGLGAGAIYVARKL